MEKMPLKIRQCLYNKTGVIIGIYVVLTLLSFFLLQQQGADYLDATLLKATASYGVARGLNGMITVVKESSVSAGFVVEGTIAIGQILDPVNDLIERFSWVMLLSIVSLGIQKILMAIGVKVGIGIFIMSLAALLIGMWALSSPKVGYKLLILAIIIQTAIPITATIGAVVSTVFMQERYAQAEQAITQAQQAIQEAIGEESGGKEEKWYDKIDPRKIIEKVKGRAAELTRHIVNLIILFIFETVVLPLGTLWGLLQVLKMFIGTS